MHLVLKKQISLETLQKIFKSKLKLQQRKQLKMYAAKFYEINIQIKSTGSMN